MRWRFDDAHVQPISIQSEERPTVDSQYSLESFLGATAHRIITVYTLPSDYAADAPVTLASRSAWPLASRNSRDSISPVARSCARSRCWHCRWRPPARTRVLALFWSTTSITSTALKVRSCVHLIFFHKAYVTYGLSLTGMFRDQSTCPPVGKCQRYVSGNSRCLFKHSILPL